MNTMNNYIIKKMIMHMRQETVDEFLKRGGTLRRSLKYSTQLGLGGGIKNVIKPNPLRTEHNK